MLKLKKMVCLISVTGLLFCLTGSRSLASREQVVITGRTMGTFYTVKFISKKKESVSTWEKRIDMRLKHINRTMSMYDPKSELSDFNRHQVDMAFPASHDFFALLKTAQQLYTLTSGAWDGTVKPLVDLWGFGSQKKHPTAPDPRLIHKTMLQTGFSNIILTPPSRIKKKVPVTLDLGSIAKGWGTDAIKDLLHQFRITDCMVEIGGEICAMGKNRQNMPWVVGISRPDTARAHQGPFKVVRLQNLSIATSGNYRNFFIYKGRQYSHIIDPKTGYPIDNSIVSATVTAPSCTFADGLATALMVMPSRKGIDLVDSIAGTECLIIEKNGDRLETIESKNFHRLYRHP